nr:unnamed protein product [Leishmania braziliensis]
MRRLVLAAGSLVADFELAHGGLARTELDEQIARSPFTRTWALYQRVAAPEETLAPRAAPPAALQDSESFASLDVEEPPAVLRREGTPEVATMVAHEARAPALQRRRHTRGAARGLGGHDAPGASGRRRLGARP